MYVVVSCKFYFICMQTFCRVIVVDSSLGIFINLTLSSVYQSSERHETISCSFVTVINNSFNFIKVCNLYNVVGVYVRACITTGRNQIILINIV